ncbi:hypothetical protein I7V28_16840 [Lelliottia amnigena]|uniref:hypothetical protein n=1 Tax=Lelliottia amnigena TaxID=61646 RepID=UPI00192AECE8|nr:hypothetical protein [Lelliottia amnigena]MBL5922749.1 hypothetical protein [Lelliottia amnigena]
MDVIKNYRQIREYKKCLDHIGHAWNVSVSDNERRQLVSRGDYYKLVRAIVSSFKDKKKIKEAETELASVVNNDLLPEEYFQWLHDSDRIACFSWYYIMFYPAKNISSIISNRCTVSGVAEKSTIKNCCMDMVTLDDYVDAIMQYIDEIQLPLSDKIKYLSEMQRFWRKEYNAYPQPFDWLNKKSEEDIQWAWDYMVKNLVHFPMNPINSYQRWQFIEASFYTLPKRDLTELISIRTRNQKRVSKKAQHEIDTQDLEVVNFQLDHENVDYKSKFLKEMKNAWAQKNWRERSRSGQKKEKVSKLDSATLKKLNQIQQETGEGISDIISRLVDEELSHFKNKNLWSH